MDKINVGISSCLLGEKVRWNGDHKQNWYAKEILGNYFEYFPVCPEVEVGMGVPRETVHLKGDKNSQTMVGTKTGKDWTRQMTSFSADKVEELARLKLCGFIFQKKSPSCGLFRVPLYPASGKQAISQGRGMFAQAFTDRFPLIPVEEEGRLNDPKIRENFIIRVFSYFRLRKVFDGRFSRGTLVRFHTAQKFLLLAHSRKYYDALGRLVAQSKQLSPAELKDQYASLFMQALSFKSTAKKNTDVLMHMMGFLKKNLSATEKKDILSTVEDYRNELVPLIVPLTLIRHHVNTHNIEYLSDQVYLNPHPKELMLRNHV